MSWFMGRFLCSLHVFSEGIAVSDAVESSHFLSIGGTKIFTKLWSKIVKSPKIGGKVCAHNFA